MGRQARMRWKTSSKLERAGVLLLLLPMVLPVQSTGGRDLLLHSHGEAPLHVHVVPHEAPAHVHGHDAPHAPPVDGDDRDASAIRLCSAGPLLPGSARAFDACRWIATPTEIGAEPWRPEFGEMPLAPDRRPPDRPPPRKHRSVLASLLSSSRAILI